MDLLLGGGDSFFVREHDRKLLARVAVGISATGGSIEVVLVDGPLSHVGKLHID